MSNRLPGRIAVVTGARSDSGRAIAVALAAEGAAVVCGDIRRDARAEGYEADRDVPTDQVIVDRGGRSEFVRTDVSQAADVQALVAAGVDGHGRIDINGQQRRLVLRTSRHHRRDRGGSRPDDGGQREGCLVGLQYAITAMVEQEPTEAGYRGKIVNIASVGGIRGLPQEPAYCSSKGAVVNLTRQLALDFGAQRIAVNTIAPGLIETAMVRDWLDNPDLAAAHDGAYPWADRGQAVRQ